MKNLISKEIKNIQSVKGGEADGNGKGTRNTTKSSQQTRPAELL